MLIGCWAFLLPAVDQIAETLSLRIRGSAFQLHSPDSTPSTVLRSLQSPWLFASAPVDSNRGSLSGPRLVKRTKFLPGFFVWLPRVG